MDQRGDHKRVTRQDVINGALSALVAAFYLRLTSFVKQPLLLTLLYTLIAFVFVALLGPLLRALRRRLERKKQR